MSSWRNRRFGVRLTAVALIVAILLVSLSLPKFDHSRYASFIRANGANGLISVNANNSINHNNSNSSFTYGGTLALTYNTSPSSWGSEDPLALILDSRVDDDKAESLSNSSTTTTMRRQTTSQPITKNTNAGLMQQTAVTKELRYKLTFTNFGWFHPNQDLRLKFPRALSTAEFVKAVQAHPDFDETAFLESNNNSTNTSNDEEQPLLVFLDIETCAEVTWPSMGWTKYHASDVEDGRKRMSRSVLEHVCHNVERALLSEAIQRHPQSRLFLMHCNKPFPGQIPAYECAVQKGRMNPENQNTNVTANLLNTTMLELYSKLVVAHLGSHKSQVLSQDFGLSTLPIRPIEVSARDLCSKRPLLFAFQGRERIPFPEFRSYFENVNDDDVFVNFTGPQPGISALPPSNQSLDPYYQLLPRSTFFGSPRGDNLYSYRLPETLSAGAIPVIYADGWVLPFTSQIVRWNQIAVVLAQEQINDTLAILRNFSQEEICSMQRKGQDFYQSYVKNSTGRLKGVVEIMNARLAGDDTITFDAVPGDRYWDWKG